MSIARTQATGSKGMLGELLSWSSSYELDRALLREDLLGSAAHVTMLARTGLIAVDDARTLRDTLHLFYKEARVGALALSADEEDVHMAVEAELGRRLGAVAGYLHTARSRNDQVALDLRLHVREQAALALADVANLAEALAERAAREKDTLLPAYTHRQRAQPISAAFLLSAWAFGILRAGETIAFAISQLEMPLGSGACSGTSLPIDRKLVADLLGGMPLTPNALDTVGDRGFALDWTWAASRVLLALSKLATDVIDFATSEFAFVQLDDEIAAGSSMMPQKKNPDVYELVRGKSARAIGNVVSLLTLVKGLPSGYNRDQQEDRLPLLEAGPTLRGALRAVHLALQHTHFQPIRTSAAVADGSTQATDLAEALVQRGVPFREAYRAVGGLVRFARDTGTALSQISAEEASQINPMFDANVLRVLHPREAVGRKKVPGGTAPESVADQLAEIRVRARRLLEVSKRVPSLDDVAKKVFAEPLESEPT